MAETRIVSLIASATEIVAALGLGDQLVGRSHECDYPPVVDGLPVCSEPKIDVHGTSREIDERVKSLAGDAISIYRVFPDLLRDLRPTHIITQTQCEVCAVSLKDVEQALSQIIGMRPEIVALAPMSLADVWSDIETVGRALGIERRANEFVRSLQQNLEAIRDQAARASHRPTIACIEWIDPLMAAGNWVPELVEIAGGQSVVGIPGQHSPWLKLDDLVARDPEVIAVMPCGFDIPRTQAEMAALARRPEWSRLRAVRAGRVYLTDGNQFFNRPGPRLVESAQILAEILHPDLFAPSMQNSGWLRSPS
jgi:iron complex transport system substrate-binding protein